MTGKLPFIDYASHPLYGGMYEPHPVLGRRAVEALQPLIAEMQALEDLRASRFGYKLGAADAIGAELAETGLSRIQLSGAVMDRIERGAAPLVSEVEARIDEARAAGQPLKYKTALAPIQPAAHPQLWSALEAAAREAGVLEIAATFFDAPAAKLHACGLLVNKPDQDWAVRLFPGLEVEAPPTAGFHVDSNGKCFVKAVLYLNDVGPDQGPFSLVNGSHRWDEGAAGRVRRRAFDKSELVSRSGKKRRIFASLPPELQVKAEFGGDMLADAPETKALLEQEIVATGPRGQLALFDPESVHRGGNVRRGERKAILVTTEALW